MLGGMLEAISTFGAVPWKVVRDQQGHIDRIRQGRHALTAQFESFRGTMGMRAVLARPERVESVLVAEFDGCFPASSFGEAVECDCGNGHPHQTNPEAHCRVGADRRDCLAACRQATSVVYVMRHDRESARPFVVSVHIHGWVPNHLRGRRQ